jgi:predicted CoA-binding protein
MPDIKEILDKNKTIAMVGVSKDPKKPSTIVMKYMQEYGFKVIPVNPRAKGEKIHGEEVFEKITDIKEKVEIVDVFRPSKEVYAIAEDAVKIGAKVLWLQLGIRDEKAKELVEKNDIEYVDNKCTKMEYQKFFLKMRQAFPVLSDLKNEYCKLYTNNCFYRWINYRFSCCNIFFT